MKRMIVGGLAVLVLAVGIPSAAQAHTLLPKDAANAAWLAAYDWGEGQSRYGDLEDVDLSRSDCMYRINRHTRICYGSVDFYDYDLSGYDSLARTNCAVVVRVHLGASGHPRAGAEGLLLLMPNRRIDDNYRPDYHLLAYGPHAAPS